MCGIASQSCLSHHYELNMKLFQVILQLHLVIQEKEKGFPGGAVVKNPAANAGDEIWVRSLGQEDLLEKGLATHSSILAWRVPQTEESGGLQSMGSQGVRTLSD